MNSCLELLIGHRVNFIFSLNNILSCVLAATTIFILCILDFDINFLSNYFFKILFRLTKIIS